MCIRDRGRLGFSAPLFEQAAHTFCIDHHISNQSFAEENHIKPEASSTSELVYHLLDEEKISVSTAEALYLGIVHDTGVFQDVYKRQVVENAEEAVYEEKKIEEQEVVFLMDRFGYAKTVDVATYERNKEAADNENKHIVHCLNTGKLCLFTADGKMHQIKVLDLPFGKFRDKGLPIDNVSNYDSTKEELIYILSLIHI